MPWWWAVLLLLAIMTPVAIVQLAMISAAIGPDRAPLTRLIGAIEILVFGVWIALVSRLVRAP